ncbi:OsmC family protein [Levilactobacillus tujiorum]|uniref:OsmC family protein n=1 Tax=Levilactobacillus tujiorum TaxID=2912243 RepID=A0ABX1L4A9_9LACO|nr:OsmC family protein [Levilactobacillus tujiorum]MCH5464824.1 OsmC family protein [Levilactobacillus tujiorum]NLR11878.1 OsmC family protein [Lactobacillus sp. HBUAS51387]NLR29860.1 OsmC family protein [Levilactobacillus tujiorum]
MASYQATARKIPSSLQVDVHSRGIHTTIDEPESLGGTNTGMNPVELVLSSLGASLQETAARLATENKFKYEQMTVDLEGDLDAAGFVGDPDIRNGFQEIRYSLQFKTQAGQAECEKFADLVTQNCPIEGMLSHGVTVALDRIEIV